MFYKVVFLFGLFIFTGLQLFTLKTLDYTTSSITWFAKEELNNTLIPADNFRIGNLDWDLRMYRKTPELEPFRRYFLSHCQGLTGVNAVSCLSKKLTGIIPFGEPENEMFNERYSPVFRFEESLRGKPGHCVTYSTMTVNALLSVGIPARFVQVFINDVGGHNVIEVWDSERGWVFFDPLNNGVLVKNGKYLSVIEAISSDEKIELIDVDTNMAARGYLADSYINETGKLLADYVIYPEPWLYTRVGEKKNNLYRSSFAAVGNKVFTVGPLQDLLRIGILLCSFFGLIVFLLIAKRYLLQFKKRENRKIIIQAHATKA